MPTSSTTVPRPPPPAALQPPPASASKALSHSAPPSPLYPGQAQSQLRPGRPPGGGPNARRPWLEETPVSRESGSTFRPPLRAAGSVIERNGRWEDGRAQASTRTVSSHSSDSSTSDRSGSSLRAEALSISSTSSSSTALATPRTSSLGSEDLEPKAPSPLSLPPLLPSKSERKKNGLGGVLKGWFGGSGTTKHKKKELSTVQPRERQASADSVMSDFEVVSPPLTPVDGQGDGPSALGLTIERPPQRRTSPSQQVTAPEPATAREVYRATGAVPSPSFATQPAPTIPVAPPLSRARTSSSSPLPQMTRTPPSLTPLQSLHLLSAQKLSIMFRPSPHPLFISRSGLGQQPPPGLGAAAVGGTGPGRRYPASTNPLTRRNQQRYLGLAAEAGIRTIMRKLEQGMVASPEEVEALIRLFAARPIALVKDKSGRFVATISEPSDLDASLVDALAPALPFAKSAAAGQLGSGILAFIRRPSFESRYTETLPHPQVLDRTFSFDVVRPRKGKSTPQPSSGSAQRPSSTTLRFSTALNSLAAEVESGQVFRTLSSKSPSATTSLLPMLSTGRTSPTDAVLQGATAPLVEAPTVPIAASPALEAPSALKSTPSRSWTMSPPTFQLTASSPSPRHEPATAAPSARAALTIPGVGRNGTVTRRSASFSGLETHLESSAIADDDEEEDAVPLSVVARRQSFATLTSTRATSTTPPARPPSTPTTPVPARAARGVRFSVDTEVLVRATEERLAAEAEAEKTRLRDEEAQRRRADRIKAEMAATRERRESAKVGGQKKGNGGQFEDWSQVGTRANAPTTMPSKASMRDLALPPAPSTVATHGASHKASSSVSNAGPAPSSFGPRSRSSRQLSSQSVSRSPSSDRLQTISGHRGAKSPATDDLQPPSLVYDSGNSSPQTSLASCPLSGGHATSMTVMSKRRSVQVAPHVSSPPPTSASARGRSSQQHQQLKSHASVANFGPSSASTASTVRQEHTARPMSHSRSSPAIPTVGHMGGFYTPPVPVLSWVSQAPYVTNFAQPMDFGPAFGSGLYPYQPQHQQHALGYQQHYQSQHHHPSPHHPTSSSRSRHLPNMR